MKRPLEKYAAKRTFARTPEPGPSVVTRGGPLLFVVQKHAARRLHYDFRLELDGVLKSWAVPKGPSLDPANKRMAVEVEDHPFDYASFEGVIPPKQYGAGNVIVWDCGVYSPDEDGRTSFHDRRQAEARVRAELAAGKLSFFLRGEKLKGSFALVRTSGDHQWLLIKHKDRFAQASDVLARAQSVLSGATLDDLSAAEPPPRLDAARLAPTGPQEDVPAALDPMLAEVGDAARSHADWLYEPKMDGYRVIAFVNGSTIRLQSRRRLDLTAQFPEIVADLAAQSVDSMILDGEIVALAADGRPSFNALQNRAQLKTAKEIQEAQRRSPVAMVCFDLLHFAGLDLRASSYVERRRWLAQCLLPSAHLQLVHVSDDAEKLYDASLASGFEGIVAKRKDAAYRPGRRTPAWRKIKATRTAEFVVGGYTKGKGAREALGALLLGYWSGRKLRYAGHVGSGLNDQAVGDLRRRLAELETAKNPFSALPPRHRPTKWTEPKLVAEVEFADWTPDGHLRAPVFVRLRDDVTPRSIKSGPDEAGASGGAKAGANSDTKVGANSRAKAGTSRGAKAAGRAAAATKGTRSRGVRVPRNDGAGGVAAREPDVSAGDIAAVLEQLDVKAKQIELEVGAARIRLTNLDRVYWPADPRGRRPAITKRELVRYFARVSPFMLPHLKDRPLTMIRMPEGIGGERFFQKHWEHALPDFVETITVFSGHKGEKHDYLLANNLPTLLWLAQVGSLELHVWHSRARVEPDAASRSTEYAKSLAALEASVLNYPDYLVFDIDPYIYSGKEAKGAEPELNRKGFATGKRVAFWLRELLRSMSLEAIVKTSGKTGLHVFVPIERTVTFDEVRHICETVGRHLVRAHPKEITMEWAVEKRTGKIFMDYNMNVRGKTLNVAYSPRGVPGAPISMPLTWEELEAAVPMDFTIGDGKWLERLDRNGDRWHDALSAKQNLAETLARATRDSDESI